MVSCWPCLHHEVHDDVAEISVWILLQHLLQAGRELCHGHWDGGGVILLIAVLALMLPLGDWQDGFLVPGSFE